MCEYSQTSRYTNTLMVSLNNRIYFRDHRTAATAGVDVDSDHIVESDQFHHSTRALFRFSQAGSPAHSTAIGDSFKLDTISHTMIDLEKEGKGDAHTVSVSSDPR